MSGPVLTVAVTADVTDLQTKMAAARSAYNASSSALNKLANDARKAGEDLSASLNPQVAQTAAAVATARAQMSALSAEISSKLRPAVEQSHAGFSMMNGVIGQNRVAFAELGHTVRSVADGLASGISPARLFGEEFFRVGQALTEFNTVSFATVARFGGIAAAIAVAAGGIAEYLHLMTRVRSENALGADLAALNVPIDNIHALNREMRVAGHAITEFSGLTDAAREKIIRDFQDISFGGESLTTALVSMLPDFSSMMGLQAPEAAAKLKGALTDLSGEGTKLMEALHVSDAALADFQTAAAQDPKRAIILFTDDLRGALDKLDASANAAKNSSISFMSIFDDLKRNVPVIMNELGMGGLGGVVNPGQLTSRRDAAAQQAAASRSALNTATASIPNNLAPDPTAIQNALELISQDTTRTSNQIVAAQASYVKRILDLDHMEGDQRIRLTAEYNRLKHEAIVSGGEEVLRETELQADRAGAAAGASRKSVADAELAVDKAALNNSALTADQRIELSSRIARLQIRDNRATATEAKKTAEETWQAYKATVEEQINADKENFSQKIALLRQEEQEAEKLFGAKSAKAKETEAEITAVVYAQGQARLRAQETLLETERNMKEAQASLDSTGAKPGIGEFKPSLGLVFDSSGLDSKVDAEVAKLRAKLNDDLAGLQQEIVGKLDLAKSLDPASDAYADLVKSASADLAKLAADQKAFTDAAVQINQRAATAVQESWEKITSPVGHAFDAILDAALSNHRNIGLAAEKAAESVVESWAKAGIQVVTEWAAMELRKLFLSRASAAAEAALGGQSSAQELAQLTQTLQRFITNESAKTAAVATGAASQTAVKAAASAGGAAMESAANTKSIMGAAGKAAANVYADVSSIPWVGWILAPAAAVGAFAAVAAYQTVASAEGGWDRVPSDGAPAVLHKDEMVLPAHLADGVRSMTRNGVSTPGISRPALGTGASINTNTGDVSHSLTLNHSPTVNIRGSNDSVSDVKSAMQGQGKALYGHLQAWYGNNSASLPGRKSWR